MDPSQYSSKLAELRIQIHALLNAATTDPQLQQLQQLLLDWHSQALAKEISLSIQYTARSIKNRTLLGEPIGGQQL